MREKLFVMLPHFWHFNRNSLCCLFLQTSLTSSLSLISLAFSFKWIFGRIPKLFFSPSSSATFCRSLSRRRRRKLFAILKVFPFWHVFTDGWNCLYVCWYECVAKKQQNMQFCRMRKQHRYVLHLFRVTWNLYCGNAWNLKFLITSLHLECKKNFAKICRLSA